MYFKKDSDNLDRKKYNTYCTYLLVFVIHDFKIKHYIILTISKMDLQT